MKRPQRPRLIPHWRRVLRYGLSVRWMALSAVFIFLDLALPIFRDYLPISPLWFALISLGVAVFARILPQPKIFGDDE